MRARGLSGSVLNSAQINQGLTANRQDTKLGQFSRVYNEGTTYKARIGYRGANKDGAPGYKQWGTITSLSLGGPRVGAGGPERMSPWAGPDGRRPWVEGCCGPGDARRGLGSQCPSPLSSLTHHLLVHTTSQPTGSQGKREPTDAVSWGLRRGWRREGMNEGRWGKRSPTLWSCGV